MKIIELFEAAEKTPQPPVVNNKATAMDFMHWFNHSSGRGETSHLDKDNNKVEVQHVPAIAPLFKKALELLGWTAGNWKEKLEAERPGRLNTYIDNRYNDKAHKAGEKHREFISHHYEAQRTADNQARINASPGMAEVMDDIKKNTDFDIDDIGDLDLADVKRLRKLFIRADALIGAAKKGDIGRRTNFERLDRIGYILNDISEFQGAKGAVIEYDGSELDGNYDEAGYVANITGSWVPSSMEAGCSG